MGAHSMLIPEEVKRRGLMGWLAKQLGEHRVTTSLKFHGKIRSGQAWCERVAKLLNVEVEELCPWLQTEPPTQQQEGGTQAQAARTRPPTSTTNK